MSIKSELYVLYKDRNRYRELLQFCHDTDDKFYYVEMLDYLDRCIEILEGMVSSEADMR